MKVFQKAANWIVGDMEKKALTKRAVERRYQSHQPELSKHLAFVDFCDEKNLFLLNDGVSVGSGFELGDISAEAASPEYIQAVFERVKETFSYVVPMYKDNPWVMQMFVADEFSLKPAFQHMKHAVDENIKDMPFTKDYFARLNDLFEKMTRPDGLFIDPKTDMPYRGRMRRIRVLFYRLYQTQKVSREEAVIEHEEVIGQVMTRLKAPGLRLKKLTGKNYYQWWLRWFHPKPFETEGNVNTYLSRFPYPSIENKPAGFDFAHAVLGDIHSTDEGFLFDGMPHRIMVVDGVKTAPEPGLLSREMRRDNPKHCYALLDKLPEGSMYTISVVFSDDEAISNHLQRLEKGILGTSSRPSEVREDIKSARDEMSFGNRLYWVNQAVLYRAEDEEGIKRVEKALKHLFFDARMPLIDAAHDLHPLNTYLNALPFNYAPALARKQLGLERLMYASELAALLPVYGRSKGALDLPCFPFFNRLGEPFTFDILSSQFITQNSHMGFFANSGAGKSVMSGWMINSLMATKNARIVLFEMGHSFDRILVHAKSHGKKVKQLMLSNKKSEAVPLNPFCEAYKALSEISNNLSEEQASEIAQKMIDFQLDMAKPATDAERACDEERSYLKELSLALRTMITEANPLEEEKFTLADETLLVEVLSDAVLTSFENKIPQMLTEHVVAAFQRRMEKEENTRKKNRLLDMHDRLKSYVIDSSKSRFFNVPTDPLGDFDIFHIDISAIRDDQGKLALVMVSLLPKILAMAEATQNDERSTFLFIDEAHLQFEIPCIVSTCLLAAKVARKLGLWLVVVTQNIEDMNSIQATKILTLLETLILLGINEKELSDLKAFKTLTPEQEDLIRSIDSEKGVYAEAVLLGSRYQGLFRVIPPRYLLALLMTEKNEKTGRKKLEDEHGILEAAEIMAKNLENQTRSTEQEDYFYDDDCFDV